jgi:DNA-3-methyladenine glycosylase II
MKLKEKQTIEIVPTLPFHFDSTFYKPGHFPSSDTKWEPGKRWQTMLWEGKKLGLIYRDVGSQKAPKIVVNVYCNDKLSSDFLENLKNEIIWRFNLDLDLADFYQKAKKDTFLKPIIERFYGLRPMSYSSLYEYLIIGIMLQNTVVKRSVSMLQSLFEKYGQLLEYGNEKLRCYWEPKTMAEADEQELRALKVGYRAKSLIRVSIPFAKEEINEIELRGKTTEEQEKILLSLYGVGPQTLGYIMFDGFHHWDYIRNISPWEQKIYSHIFFDKELVPVNKMLKYFEKWGKWKGLAVHYVWEDIWWKRRNENIPWLEKLIRV